MTELYRKKSLKKISSPEALDKMVEIIPISLWIAIVAGGVIILGCIIWGIYGEIPVIATGQGVYYDMGKIQNVYAQQEGTITACSVSKEEAVKPGDVLCVIADETGEASDVCSEISGLVIDIPAEKGKYVSRGEILFKLRKYAEGNQGYVNCYVPLAQARKIKPGMEVMIYPDYLNTRESGYMMGHVTKVSKFVLTENDLKNEMVEQGIIDSIMGKRLLIEITCALEKDPESVNGYQWTNKKGTEIEIADSTKVTANFVIDSKSPFEMLF